jgi:predicted dithiol-disulfide oxidoreductase (DUF899 family)/uncharacterized damage-inducible protein DinB
MGHAEFNPTFPKTREIWATNNSEFDRIIWLLSRGEATMATAILNTKAVGPTEWLAARKELLKKEKEFTRLRDDISRLRRELPWEKVEKDYVFEGPTGKVALTELFRGKSQLVVYHFMFGPGWQAGCPSCSFIADNFDGMRVHLEQRDVAFAAISRATLPEIEAFKKRMGWKFPWLSSNGTDFNYDYKVSFTKEDMTTGKRPYNFGTMDFPSDEGPGLSVFYKDNDGQIYHTYSTYARGLDILLTMYNYIDMTPKGRDEANMTPHAMAWVRHHDRYEDSEKASSCCSGEAEKTSMLLEPVIAEFREEVPTMRRMLERVPADKLTWKPHERSMTLGQLAIHLAQIPDRTSGLAMGEGFDVKNANFVPPQPKDKEEILTAFDANVREGEARLRSLSEEKALQSWTLRFGDREVFTVPRVGVVRSIMLNHWYHHRGQLSVYLRLLEVPVPVSYGRTADENPFA